MIYLEDIYIGYDHVLLNNAKILLAPGKINVIQGESGSGKSSLLYLIGLMKTDTNVNYYYHSKLLDMKNDQEIADIRKKNIGYVFQENSLITHLSIYENLKLYANLSGKILSKRKAEELLVEVALDKDIQQPITTLSGGEKQRLAIACALVKEPELLILDEPTSALDSKNALLIMEILRNVANSGTIVLLTSHDEAIVKLCDVRYVFKNNQLVCEKQLDIADSSFMPEKVKLKWSFYLTYVLNYFKGNLGSFFSLVTVLGFVVALLIGYQEVGMSFEQMQLDSLNDIANCEMLVTSQKDAYGEAVFHDQLPEISVIKMDNIRNIEVCDAVYPFYQGYSSYVKHQDQEYEWYCTIQPYTPKKDLSKIAEVIYDLNNDIYLSNYLFQQLNFIQDDNLTIDFNLELPNGKTVVFESEQIAGVLPNNYKNHYTNNAFIIYVPYDKMPMIEKVQALFVYADHYQHVDKLKEELLKVDVEFGIFNEVFRISYLDDVLKTIKMVTPFLMTMLILISVSVIVIIYTRYINNRKIEMCLLKVNGLSKKEMIIMIVVELIIQIASITMISILLLFVMSWSVNQWTPINIQTASLTSLSKGLGYSALFILPPTMISLWFFQKKDLTYILRN